MEKEIKVLVETQTTITLELINKDCYKTDEFEVYITKDENKTLYGKFNTNCFTLFNLESNTNYIIEVEGYKKVVSKTKKVSKVLDVKDFHAKADGITNDTLAIECAIMAAGKDDLVYISSGTYLVTSLFLKSDLNIYIDKDAKLIGELDRNLYPIIPSDTYGVWEGEKQDIFASLITAINCNNITIVGEGVIDGRSIESDWYINHRVKRIAYRPYGLYFYGCKNVNLVGFTTKNSPSWNIHPIFCENTNICDVKIYNPHHMPTTDGIDPDCCKNTNIVGVYFSVGDDCIAIKSGQYEFAKEYKTPCSYLTISNCYMHKGHGGVVFGSESSAGINNVKVNNCLFEETDRGLRIKTRRGRGRVGIIDNVDFDNITMNEVKAPFVINMYYSMGPAGGHCEYVWSHEAKEVNELTPFIGSFHFKNMVVTNCHYTAGVFLGLKEAPIEKVKFENITFTYNKECESGIPAMVEFGEKVKNQGLFFENVKEIEFENVKITDAMTDKIIVIGDSVIKGEVQ